MSDDPYGTEPMFPVPAKYRPRAVPKKPVQWRKYVGKRTSCDLCIQDLAYGATQFLASPASFTRETATERRYVCHRHAATWRISDDHDA